MPINQDFKDLFSALLDAKAEFLVVGAHAVMLHTAPRYTKDLDLWVRPTETNAERVFQALSSFGAPMDGVRVEDLCAEETVFQIGIEPNRIDIITSIAGVDFGDAWNRRVHSTYGDTPIHLLGPDDLITNKRTVGRPQDLLDVDALERARDEERD